MTSKPECTSGAAPLAGAVRPDEKTGAGGSAPAPVNVNGGRTIAQVIAEYDAALLAGDAQGTYLGRMRLRAFAAPAPVPAGDGRSTAFLDWWHEHGRKLCITPECAEYVFEAGRSKQVPAGDAVALAAECKRLALRHARAFDKDPAAEEAAWKSLTTAIARLAALSREGQADSTGGTTT